MRHPRIDLRTIHGGNVSEGTRAVLTENLGDLLAELPAARPEGRRVYSRSVDAQDRRRHRAARPLA